MPAFSNLSRSRLDTCDSRLVEILEAAIERVDFSVLCGHRTEEEQNEAFRLKRSTKRWPESKHNRQPSIAVDIAPYFPDVRIDWDDLTAFGRLAGYVERIAHEKGIRIRWGGDWDMDGRTADERFIDGPHIELVED